MSTSSRHRPASPPSTASLNHTGSSSARSFRRPPPPVTTVVTSPPWARDEPPSPKDLPTPLDGQTVDQHQEHRDFGAGMSDVASLQSRPEGDSRWWTFTLPRTRPVDTFDRVPGSPKPERKTFRDISLPWMLSQRDSAFAAMRKDKDKEKEETPDDNNTPGLSVPIPAASNPVQYTLSHTSTPGWETPWSARLGAQGPRRPYRESYGFEEMEENESNRSHKELSPWKRRKKKLRAFILINTYVPLLFRVINISFTTAALGMAIHIRLSEMHHHAAGAIGSSPTVVIIFAPLTLMHVMIAIYLEYFGRPLGLWRTSAKLAHTLSEVLFICAWSAALSLCFDNFFTSLIPCADAAATAWYNELPRPPENIPGFTGPVAYHVCRDQLSLICLVAIGLIAYCSNLIISLYRIFEKVKYHPTSQVQPSVRRSSL